MDDQPSSMSSTRWYRCNSMDELRAIATNPLWHDGEETQGIYTYPIHKQHSPSKLINDIPQHELYELNGIVCTKSPQSHIGPYINAIDFLVADGTPIVAVDDGIVVRFNDTNNEWGDGPEFRDKVNFIDIRHDNGEVSEYCHLAERSIRDTGIRVGDKIKRGQQIGIVGKTGWTDRDHLHFVIFRDDEPNNDNPLTEAKFKSLNVRFTSE